MIKESVFRKRFVLVLLMYGTIIAGCGVNSQIRPPESMPVPTTNEAAQKAVAQALAGIQIPPGEDRELAVQCTGDTTGFAFEMAGMVFGRSGYRVTRNSTGFPRLTIRVDSLVVTTRERLSSRQRGATERNVEAMLTIEYQERDGLSQIFQVAGTVRDNLPSETAGELSGAQSSTMQNRVNHPFPAYVKPTVLGFFMTILVWSLYSYRG